MLELLKRLFKISKAKAQEKLDQAEDPIKLTEQSIKDLKIDLAESLRSLAEVKALHIRTRRDVELQYNTANDYEKKAIALLQRAQRGEIASDEADRLAAMAISRKEEIMQRVEGAAKNLSNYEQMVRKLEENSHQLKAQITTWEHELHSLKARARVSEATRKLNEKLSQVDSQSTLAILQRMKDKVEEQEAIAESYTSVLDGGSKSLDDEINRALGGSFIPPKVNATLDRLKQQIKAEEEKNKKTEQLPPADEMIAELNRLKSQLKKDVE